MCRRTARLAYMQVPASPAPQMETDGSSSNTEELLTTPLQQNEALQLGALANGLRYVILPNRSPPARFEAHLEVHAGSGALHACLVRSMHGGGWPAAAQPWQALSGSRLPAAAGA